MPRVHWSIVDDRVDRLDPHKGKEKRGNCCELSHKWLIDWLALTIVIYCIFLQRSFWNCDVNWNSKNELTLLNIFNIWTLVHLIKFEYEKPADWHLLHNFIRIDDFTQNRWKVWKSCNQNVIDRLMAWRISSYLTRSATWVQEEKMRHNRWLNWRWFLTSKFDRLDKTIWSPFHLFFCTKLLHSIFVGLPIFSHTFICATIDVWAKWHFFAKLNFKLCKAFLLISQSLGSLKSLLGHIVVAAHVINLSKSAYMSKGIVKFLLEKCYAIDQLKLQFTLCFFIFWFLIL